MLNVYLNLLYLSNLQTATNSMDGILQQSAKFLQVGTQGHVQHVQHVHCTTRVTHEKSICQKIKVA